MTSPIGSIFFIPRPPAKPANPRCYREQGVASGARPFFGFGLPAVSVAEAVG